jgi:hypothetical protein
VAARIHADHPDWRVSVRPDLDRVELSIVVLNDLAVSGIGADAPAIVVEPLVLPS